jgi:hypothetical protein
MPNIVRGGTGWGQGKVDGSALDEVQFEEFYPKIHIYKNLLPSAARLVEILKESGQDRASSYYFNMWDKWHVFGETIGGITFNPIYEDLIEEEKKAAEEVIVRELDTAFAKATQHYMRHYGVTKGNDWTTMGPSICKYDSEMEHCGLPDLSMKYHTDYDYIRGDEPGDKFAITCTMYLNDNYEGGEMWFNLSGSAADSFGETPLSKDQIMVYKPEAGDVLVFPSGHPDVLSEDSTYFHGVSRTWKSKEKPDNKYFIRSYYLIPFEGTPEWLSNQEKYGEDIWEKMETERIKARVKTHEELQIIKTRTSASDKECGLY